jgi:hypothetical protein
LEQAAGRSEGLSLVPWSARFDDPIPVPKGKPFVTLQDAGAYITKLPKAEHEAPEWQAAMEALILVAESNGPTMFARIGIMQALNRHVRRQARDLRDRRKFQLNQQLAYQPSGNGISGQAIWLSLQASGGTRTGIGS